MAFLKSTVVALLAVLGLGLLASGPAPVSAVTPGAIGAVSRAGLQGIINTVYPPILESIKHVPIEDMSGTKSGFKYEVRDLRVDEVSVASIDVNTHGGLRVDIRDLNVVVKAHWKYRKKGIPWVPRGSGTLDAHLAADDIGGTFTVTTIETPQGTRPHVKLSDLTVDISRVKIKTHGSIFSWLYNLILSAFKGKIKSTVAGFVRSTITTAVDNLAEKMINDMDFRAPISTWGVVDYSLTSGMIFEPDFLGAPLNGEVMDINNNSTDPELSRPDLVFPGCQRMLTFAITELPFTSALRVHHKTGRFARTYSVENHPPAFPLPFDTKAYAKLIPGLPQQFPDAVMLYKLFAKEESKIKLDGGSVRWHSNTGLGAYVLGADGSETHVFNIGIDLAAAAEVTVSTKEPTNVPTLYLKLGQVAPVFSVTESQVGEVDLNLVNALLSKLLNDILIPTVNAIFADGIPILSVKGFHFSNMELYVADPSPAIVFMADVSYTPPV